MTKDLILTLGHNSSAILCIDNKKVVGYSQERLSRIKSDSRFPKDAILEIDKHVKLDNISNIFISHWFDNMDFYKLQDYFRKPFIKYYNYDFIDNLIDGNLQKIKTLNNAFTHHDAHAFSVSSFNYRDKTKNIDTQHTIVADGFGNNEEVISIYLNYIEPTLIRRVYGYQYSLGLMYQYATSFCGLLPHQDEYKFLGYESKIDLESSKIIKSFANFEITRIVEAIINNNSNKPIQINQLDICNLTKLYEVKEYWYSQFNSMLSKFPFKCLPGSYASKVIIGYYIQYIIEKVLQGIIEYFDINSVSLSGGIFYNVKLNNSVLKLVNKISIPPLAGDSGAGIGVYDYYKNRSFPYSGLDWGIRTNTIEEHFDVFQAQLYNKNTIVEFTSQKEASLFISSKLINENAIVEVFTGNNEFGPRALCFSSSIMRPTSSNVDTMNILNKRNGIMPCAPVLLNKNKKYFFEKSQYKKAFDSDPYMIIAYDYKSKFKRPKYYNKYCGIMHNYPNKQIFSGRPQIIDDKSNLYIRYVLEQLEKKLDIKALINTSFNIHGKPIVLSRKDAIFDFNEQNKINNKIFTIKKPLYLVFIY